jgi:hypothetical protein
MTGGSSAKGFMNLKHLALSGMLLGLAGNTLAQGGTGRAEIEIKNIRQQQVDAPNYGGTSDLGGRPSTLWRKWLKIEVQFDNKHEWADDVQVKYYVLMGKGEDRRLFVGEVTHINVAKGSQHYSAMFMQPNTLKRYGAGQIEQITVRIFHKGTLVSTMSEPSVRDGWWDRFQPTSGYLLSPQETPWAPIADERFEAVKPSTR